MRELVLSQILDEVSTAKKRAIAQTSVVDPNGLVLARGEDSWTEDGREDLAVAPNVVVSLLRAHSSNNKTDGNPQCEFANTDGKAVIGNPVIFGHLATKNVAIMGTDEEPLLVVSAAGRQTLKASSFLTEFLALARKVLIMTKGDITKAQGKLMSDGPELFNSIREDWFPRTGIQFTEEDVAAVIAFMTEADWLLIFTGGSKIGKPLVGLTYSAVCWMKVTHTGEKPTSRRALENAKRDNLRVPSPFHVESKSVVKLVRSYVIDDGFSEEAALKHVRSTVTAPLAVGGSAVPDEEYVLQLYRFHFLCPEAHQAVQDEPDLVKKLLLFRKFTKKLFRATKEEVTRGDDSIAKLTINKLSHEEQLKLMNPEKKEKAPKPDKVEDEEAEEKAPEADTNFLSVSQFPEVSKRLAAFAEQPLPSSEDAQLYFEAKTKRYAMGAVAATLAFLRGDDKALGKFPEIESALRSASTGPDAAKELLEALEGWDGKGELRPSGDGKFRMPVTRLKDQMFDELSRASKVKDRVAWCKRWVVAHQ